MDGLGLVEIILIVINVGVSWRGFNNPSAFQAGAFEVGPVLRGKEYHRLLTSGFLHVSWQHLFFNMLSLYFFAGNVEAFLGPLYFLLIYMGSLIGGNLFSLFIHRHNPVYRAVGASGAVSGVIFAAIALFPGMELQFIFIPIPFPAWAFGLGFVLYSIYGIRSQRDNIGHEAHLGGAIIGLLIALAIRPEMFFSNMWPVFLVLIPTLIFIIIIIFKPGLINVKQPYYQFYDGRKEKSTPDEKYREEKQEKVYEMDRILDKINRHGKESLTEEERHILENHGR